VVVFVPTGGAQAKASGSTLVQRVNAPMAKVASSSRRTVRVASASNAPRAAVVRSSVKPKAAPAKASRIRVASAR